MFGSPTTRGAFIVNLCFAAARPTARSCFCIQGDRPRGPEPDEPSGPRRCDGGGLAVRTETAAASKCPHETSPATIAILKNGTPSSTGRCEPFREGGQWSRPIGGNLWLLFPLCSLPASNVGAHPRVEMGLKAG